MQRIYSFLEIKSAINHATPGISSVGEMSPYTKTFVPNDTDPYIVSNALDINFNYINRNTEGTPVGTEEQWASVKNAFDALAAKLHATNIEAGNATPNKAWVQGLFAVAIPGYTTLILDDEGWGDPVQVAVGLFIPEWFDLSMTAIGGEVYRFRIYTTDSYFKDNYPLTFYTVVPPITNTEDFIDNFASAKSIINGRTISQHIDNAQVALDGKVITGLECVTLRVYDVNNTSDYFDCPFFVGYNGALGVNHNGMINAIGDFLVSLGGYLLVDWIEAIPELDNLGTFIVIPMWDKVAVPSPVPLAAPVMYNPCRVAYDGMENYTRLNSSPGYLNGMYTGTEVRDLLEYSACSYKSIGFFIIPKKVNAEDPMKFSERYPDFIIANINTIDSAPISAPTENTIRDLHTLMQYAETWDGDLLPSGIVSENLGNPGLLTAVRYLSLSSPYGRAKLYVLVRADYDSSLQFQA